MDSPKKLAKEGWQPLPSCKFDWEITPLLILESKDPSGIASPLTEKQPEKSTFCPPPSPQHRKKESKGLLDRIKLLFRTG